jgi:hypothetical protein
MDRTRTPRRPFELKFKERRPVRNQEKYCTKRLEEKEKQPQLQLSVCTFQRKNFVINYMMYLTTNTL